MRTLGTAVLVVISLVWLGSPEARAEEVTVKAMAPWQGHGQVYLVAPEKAQFLGRYEGILYFEQSEGRLDTALLLCPGTQIIDLQTGATQADGHCIITGPKGNTVFAEWTCAGGGGQCTGEFKITGGTGDLAGISGAGDMVIRTALTGLAADLRNGEVVSGAAGLAVWPALTLHLPAP